MNKRGVGLSFETLVIAIMALVVLGVVLAIFITQSGKYAGKYSEVADKAGDQAKGCSFLFGRYCSDPCDPGDHEVSGKFDECGDKKCCEKKSSENE